MLNILEVKQLFNKTIYNGKNGRVLFNNKTFEEFTKIWNGASPELKLILKRTANDHLDRPYIKLVGENLSFYTNNIESYHEQDPILEYLYREMDRIKSISLFDIDEVQAKDEIRLKNYYQTLIEECRNKSLHEMIETIVDEILQASRFGTSLTNRDRMIINLYKTTKIEMMLDKKTQKKINDAFEDWGIKCDT